MNFTISNEYKSPNFNKNRDMGLLDAIIIHYTGMQSAQSALNYLCNKKKEV